MDVIWTGRMFHWVISVFIYIYINTYICAHNSQNYSSSRTSNITHTFTSP